MSQLANKAISHTLERIQADPRIAYYFCPLTESFSLLTAAQAEASGEDVALLRSRLRERMKFDEPKCKQCAERPDAVVWTEMLISQVYSQISELRHRTYLVHGHEKELLLAEIRGLELAHSILQGEGC